jgi:hypothetical protein
LTEGVSQIVCDIRPDVDVVDLQRAAPENVPHVRDQHSLAQRRDARSRPDRLDATAGPTRRPGQGRTQDAALPAAPRRRPTHPRPAPTLAPHPTLLASGQPARCSVHPAHRATYPNRLTSLPDPTNSRSYRQNSVPVTSSRSLTKRPHPRSQQQTKIETLRP